MTNYEIKLIEIIKNDEYIMSILETVEKLKLNDAWVAAGLIRNKVWDVLHNINTSINDIDVIYFDTTDTSWETEKYIEKKLEILMPNQPWSVKNQARMHLKNGFELYTSSFDGVAHFTEIPTAIAVKMCNSELEIMAPYGLEDLFEKVVKPTPYYQNNSKLNSIYTERMQKKKWDEIWIDLSVEA
ncbi:nucleotidyltransferase family protein [Neobacillus mesonae]|nr:nucleotidyltransferase family protein [Neobacillus mesonae]